MIGRQGDSIPQKVHWIDLKDKYIRRVFRVRRPKLETRGKYVKARSQCFLCGSYISGKDTTKGCTTVHTTQPPTFSDITHDETMLTGRVTLGSSASFQRVGFFLPGTHPSDGS